MYNLLRAVLALAACVPLSTAQVVSSPAPQNPPITYDAFSTLSVEERYNVTVYYTTTTIYGISTTIIVGDIVTNPTNATDAPCPTNFFSPTPGPYVTPGECIYCPSTGWYSTEPNACSMSMYLVGGCQSGYFVAGTQTPGGTTSIRLIVCRSRCLSLSCRTAPVIGSLRATFAFCRRFSLQ